MSRIPVLPILILASIAAFAQTPPPGDPYDPARHPNPIITSVEESDFKPSNYEEAREQADMELLGLSRSEGRRESIEIADGKFVKNMPILRGIRSDVTFYPVVRQAFKLSGGSELIMYSFKFPKVSLPPDFGKIVLEEAAVEKKKKPSEMRFGGRIAEKLEIRRRDGLLFEKDGRITVYWQEDGIGHTATASLPRRELFRIIEDLL